MSELKQIIALWHEARNRGEEYVLATVVRVEGSSYRKPGARMLITGEGRRAGTISGGCLEAEVVRKAFWLTEQGPVINRYQSSFDEDGSALFGLGCGGTIYLLLERSQNADEVMGALGRSVTERSSFAIATVIDANSKLFSRRLILAENGHAIGSLSEQPAVKSIAHSVFADRRSGSHTLRLVGEEVEVFAEYLPRATSLIIFGAGDDAQPVVEAATALGWLVTVADGRANLLRPERFPLACKLIKTELSDPLRGLDIGCADAAVIMSHSYEQDRAALIALLHSPISYLGMLGPSHRTAQLVTDAAFTTGLDRQECLNRLHSPVGLDIGADSPASIALSIVAEIFSALHARSAAPLSARRPSMLDIAIAREARA